MKLLFAKSNLYRKPQFSIGTIIYEEGKKKIVRKYIQNLKAQKHLQSLVKHQELLSRENAHLLFPSIINSAENFIDYTYLDYFSLEALIEKEILNRNYKQTAKYIKMYVDFVNSIKSAITNPGSNEEFRNIFLSNQSQTRKELSEECVTVGILDLNLDNLLLNTSNNKLYLIDCEWIYNFPIPKKYIIFRALFYLSNTLQPLIASFCSKDFPCYQILPSLVIPCAWMDAMGIRQEQINYHLLLEKNFQDYVNRVNFSRNEYCGGTVIIKTEMSNNLNNFIFSYKNGLQRKHDINNTENRLVEAQRVILELKDEQAIFKSSRFFKLADLYYHVKHQLRYSVLKLNNHLENVKAIMLEKKELDIVIPIHNAFEDLCKCVYSVLSYTYLNYNLILIDDCSTDKRIKIFLDYLRAKKLPFLHIFTNNKNLGFIKTVNQAINLSKSDVLLLNSDTIVTRNWANKILATAYANNRIGTVTPISNNATILSVPEMNTNNSLPENLSPNDVSYVLEKNNETMRKKYLEIPTGIGFCLFIKRAVIKKFGGFDEVYGQGYNEENDFCQRISKEGYLNVASIDTFIFHGGEKSFIKRKKSLEEKNHQILIKRYPDYMNRVMEFINKDPLWETRNELQAYFGNRNKADVVCSVSIDCQIFHLSPGTGSARYVQELLEGYSKREYKDNFTLLIKDSFSGLKGTENFDIFFTTNSMDPLLGGFSSNLYHRTIQCYTYEDLALLSYASLSILSLLDLIAYKNKDYWGSEDEWRNYQEITQLSVQVADRIICISDYSKKEIIRELGINPQKIETVYLGVNNKFKAIREEDVLKKFKLKFFLPDTFILYVGTDFPHKNLLQLIYFYFALPEDIRETLKLVLFIKHSGVGNILKIRNRIKEFGLENDVIILENDFSNEDLNLLYNSCFAYTNFSTDEGFSMTNLEAARCGKPLVVLETEFNREILKDGCLYFKAESDFVKNIRDLVNNRIFYNEISQKGMRVSMIYTWKQTVDNTYKIYHEQLSKNLRTDPKIKRTILQGALKKSKYKNLIGVNIR